MTHDAKSLISDERNANGGGRVSALTVISPENQVGEKTDDPQTLCQNGNTLEAKHPEESHNEDKGSAESDHMEGKFTYLPPSSLVHYGNNIFNVPSIDKVQEERPEQYATIKEDGMKNPLLVRPNKDNEEYEVIDGNARLTIACALGMESVPVIIRDMDDQEAARTSLEMNLHRSKMTSMEEARAIDVAFNSFGDRKGERNDINGGKKGATAEFVGKMFNISPRTAQRKRSLVKLVRRLQKHVENNILKQEVGGKIVKAFEDNPTVQDGISDYIDDYIANHAQTSKSKQKVPITVKNISNLEKEFKDVENVSSADVSNYLKNMELGKKPKVKSKLRNITLPDDLVDQYFNDMTEEEIIDYIRKLFEKN